MSETTVEYPEGFLDACRKIYAKIGPLAYATKVLGCWVFATPEVLYISGPMAVKIDTGEAIHFHIPALLTDEDYRKDMAGKLGVTAKELMAAMVDGDEEDWEALPRIEVSDRFKQRPPSWDDQGSE